MPEGLAFAAALLTSVLLAKPVILLLQRHHVVDIPNDRSSHDDHTPRGGGLAVLAGVALAMGASSAPVPLLGVAAGVAGAAVVGFADDLRGLAVGPRLILQLLLSGAMTTWLLREQSPSAPTLGLALICVIFIAGYMNAFNFMDGINGISALSAAAAGASFLVLGRVDGMDSVAIGGAALLGASLGFLPWNAPTAKVFLGDVGSYGLGMLIGCLAVMAVADGASILMVAAPLMVYLADTGWTLTSRVTRGRSWRDAHRDHVYQRLCDKGWSHGQVSALVLMTTAILCWATWSLPSIVGATTCALLLSLYLLSPHMLSALARQTSR